MCHLNCYVTIQQGTGGNRENGGRHDLIIGLLEKRQKVMASGQPAIVQCDAGGREVFRAFHNESIRLRNGEFRDIEGELGRWRENACRIGLGFCIADDPGANTLTKKQAERAVKLARWGHHSALQVMHGGRMERQAVRVNRLLYLIGEYGGEATVRGLEKSHGFKTAEVERLAADFPSQLHIETRQNPKGGPQSRVLTVRR